MLTHDGSDLAAAAIPHAVTIAAATGAEVVVSQVIDSVAQVISQTSIATIEPMPGGRITAELAEESVAAQRAAAQQNIEAVKAQLTTQGVKSVSTAVLEGPAGSSICDAATQLGVDMIVIATHGRSGLGRAVLGSVADHVVRHAHCAVLVIRPEHK